MRNRIPTAPLIPLLREQIASNGLSHPILAAKVGIETDTLQKLLAGRSKTIDFNVADRLLCAVGAPHLWLGPLEDIYMAADISDPEPVSPDWLCTRGHGRGVGVRWGKRVVCRVCSVEKRRRYRAAEKAAA